MPREDQTSFAGTVQIDWKLCHSAYLHFSCDYGVYLNRVHQRGIVIDSSYSFILHLNRPSHSEYSVLCNCSPSSKTTVCFLVLCDDYDLRSLIYCDQMMPYPDGDFPKTLGMSINKKQKKAQDDSVTAMEFDYNDDDYFR